MTLRVPEARAALATAAPGLLAVGDLELMARAAHAQGMAARLAQDMPAALAHLREAAALQARRGERGLIDGMAVALEIGRLENAAGRHADAAATLGAIQAPLVQRLGPQHPLAVATAADLAWAELRQGHFEPAQRWIDTLRSGSSPADAWREDHAAFLLAMLRVYRGEAAQVEPQLRQLLATREREDGGPSVGTEPVRRLLGEALLRQGRTREAEAVLRLTEAHQLRLASKRATPLALTRVLLGVALARAGERAAAQALWADALAVLGRELGPEHPQALVAAAYAALAAPESQGSAEQRERLAQRLHAELGWLDGVQALAALLHQPLGDAALRTLPALI